MQKFSTALIALLIAGGGYLLYSNKKLNNEITDLKANGGDAFLKGCNPCKSYAAYPAFDYLQASMLMNMAANYRNAMGSSFASINKGNPDAEAIWFDLDGLKRFIWEIETNVCKNKCKDATQNLNLGVRLYYSRYPVTGALATFRQLQGLDSNYKNMHTLFMVPTYDEVSGTITNHVEFDPTKFDAGKCKYLPLDGTMQLMAFGPMVQASNSTNTTAKNHGSLCPPVCPTVSIFR